MRYQEMVKLLIALGFYFARQGKGSHEIWQHPNGAIKAVSRCALGGYKRSNWEADVRRIARN
jgi:HicA toxin of bacterial toxin-antitoxin,